MGTYLNPPPGQPKAAWLAGRGAIRLGGPPSSLAAVPAGGILVAVVTASHGDAALVVESEADFDDASSTGRPVTWLLMDIDQAGQLAGRDFR